MVMIGYNLIYWLFIAVIIMVATTTVGRRWRQHENARWTLGYLIVFTPGLVLVAWGYWDIRTWAGLFVGVGISGVIKVGYQYYREKMGK